MSVNDPVNHPRHYTSHPSGVECIQITSHMGFNLGNALKYIWRCDLKQDAVEDLRKAQWYIGQEIAKRIKVNNAADPECGKWMPWSSCLLSVLVPVAISFLATSPLQKNTANKLKHNFWRCPLNQK